jgi:hypothetical protein
MIIYNVTVNIDDRVRDDWKDWMLSVHIPEVMDTGFFTEYKFCRLMNEEPQGTTFAIQYFCPSMKRLQQYLDDFAPDLQKSHTERYKDKFVAFRTFLEVEDKG